MAKSDRRLYTILSTLLLSVALNIGLWSHYRDVRPEWSNVPPVQSYESASFSALGDTQMAYRTIGLMLQNLGDTGGRTVGFIDFNYNRLGQWFDLAHRLDPRADFLPFLAAFYYSGNQHTAELLPIVEYLQKAGSVPQDQKWRWLAQASFIARFKMDDLDLSLKIARKLAALEEPDMPSWAKAMPAYILNAQGEKQAAYDIMISYLKSGEGHLHPAEVNATVTYICTQILTTEQGAQNPLCKK